MVELAPGAAVLDDQQRAQESIELVRHWLTEASDAKSASSAKLLAEILKDPNGLRFTVGFVDGVVRPQDVDEAAKSLARIAPDVPKFLPWWMRAAVRIGGVVAPIMPGVVVPLARRFFRRMVGHLIVDARPQQLTGGLARIRAVGAKLNINLLGEAVLGQGEASRRLQGTQDLLARDDVDYVSIKVSSTVAPHNAWAFDEAVSDIVERLTPLFQIAANSPVPKFINLDMEEYRDLDLTVAVFTRLLDKPEFARLSAGIVLQAYLPDALSAMIELQEWSAARRARGGADIKVRVVKGANLPMETVDATVHGWPLATWHSKLESDTNYLRVLNYAFTPERIANVRIGVAGHNLFDIAYSWNLSQERRVAGGVEYEMLLGMAEGQAEAVRQTVGDLRLYTPVVSPEQFDVAIAYLVRRLEEGASSENFMSAVFELSENSELFNRERDRFLASLRLLDSSSMPGGEPVVPKSHRVAERYAAVPVPTPGRFDNTPDTDPAVALNREWSDQVVASAVESRAGVDLIAAAKVTDPDILQRKLDDAVAGGQEWSRVLASGRADILRQVGAALEANRGLLIEVAMSETGKTLEQADPEVSEAIDFAYYYADLAEQLERVDGAQYVPRNLTLVTPPWNFPLAIPAGSVLASLAAGSGVILKPAPNAERCGAVLADIMLQAGVPKSALSLVQVGESELGQQLISSQQVDQVILTGAYETAELFRSFRPELPLFAETSGKNAIIVTPSADFDLAVKDIVHSAFGHAGQKCSAASLVVLVGSVARSSRFRTQLLDAVNSLTVGSEFDAATQVNRVVEAPSGKLLRGLTTLGLGETWLVEPRQVGDDPRLWSPGVRDGVRRGSEYHLTEYFGPILGIMTASDLDEAIDLVNDVEYGLTSGIHSLDAGELTTWLERIQAGNLYVNRGITGAIVRRQPFGGWKKSAVGPGAKAGGPNYLNGLGNWRTKPATRGAEPGREVAQFVAGAKEGLSEQDQQWLDRCVRSDAVAWREEFGANSDVSGLEVERNVFRYVPYPEPVVVRLAGGGRIAELVRVVAAGLAAGASIEVSCEVLDGSAGLVEPERSGALGGLNGSGVSDRQVVFGMLGPELAGAFERAGVPMVHETNEAWSQRLAVDPIGRVRAVDVSAEDINRQAAGRPNLAAWSHPVTEAGRIELLPFLREQAVSITAHRFGTRNELAWSILNPS